MDDRGLLEKHNPILIMLPEDGSRARPGAPFPGSKGRGDYHPCSAELFLSLVIWRPVKKDWIRFPRDLPLIRNLPQYREPALGLEELRRKVEQEQDPDAILAWELDLQPIMSQNSRRAWSSYAEIRRRPDLLPFLDGVVYGRVARGDDRIVLQYWYLYIYNDAPNKHEGDWESVSIQLDQDEKPVRAGYAGHASGYKREWSKVETEDDRPIVYVARGSHAAYFTHLAKHRTNSLKVPKNLPRPLQAIVDVGYDALRRVWPFFDSTPGRPNDVAVEEKQRGERIEIKHVAVLPNLQAGEAPPAGLWWLRLSGKWGSSHGRGFGVIGPDPPWRQGKWINALTWIEQECQVEEPTAGS